MRRLALLLLACASVALAAPADDTAIRSKYDLYTKAYKTHNVKMIVDLTTDDYTSKVSNGKEVDRATFAQVMEGQVNTATSETLKVDKLDVHGVEATAVVTEKVRNDLKNPLTGQRSVVESSNTCRDTWVRTSAGWRLKHSETLAESLLVDGKPYKP